ncbi:MAG TPA: hypothetical protein VJN96_19930 [Vicinamibacterales bacterium]|nr:hypothetical protein [Vicinamibacterales bacterium]
MKSIIRSAFILASLSFVGVSSAHAQVLDRITFTAPFPFVAAGKTLPAGTYTLAPVGDTPAVVALSSDRRTLVLMEVDPASLPRDASQRTGSEVIFTKLDNGDYAMREVWDEGNQSAADIAWTALRHAGEAAAAPAAHDVKVPAAPERR